MTKVRSCHFYTILIDQYRQAFLLSNEDKLDDFENDKSSIILSDGDELDGKPTDKAKPHRKFKMLKANIDDITEKSKEPQASPLEVGGKLSAQLLEQLEQYQNTVPVFEAQNESIIDEFKNMKLSVNEEEENIAYLEKKYLSPEFLFHNLESQNSLHQSENPSIIYEQLVNDILNESMVDYKWYFYVQFYVYKIINTVKPNQKRINEVVDYNGYSKVM